jgi:hypothetical protein
LLAPAPRTKTIGPFMATAHFGIESEDFVGLGCPRCFVDDLW